MTRVRSAAAAVLLLALSMVTIPMQARADDKADFQALTKSVIAAWQTMDPAKAAVYYSNDPSAVYFDVAPLKYVGWNAYAEGAKEMMQSGSSLTLRSNDDLWVKNYGNVAVTALTGHADMTDKSGQTMSHEWRWTAVWEKNGGSWKIEHEHFSAPAEMHPVESEKQ